MSGSNQYFRVGTADAAQPPRKVADEAMRLRAQRVVTGHDTGQWQYHATVVALSRDVLALLDRVEEEAAMKWSARLGRQKAEDVARAAERREARLREAIDHASAELRAASSWLGDIA